MPETPQPSATTRAHDAEDINIEYYTRVFGKCLEAAEGVVRNRLTSTVGDERRRLELDVATALFNRFYEDQAAIQNAERQARAMVSGIHSALESRRG